MSANSKEVPAAETTPPKSEGAASEGKEAPKLNATAAVAEANAGADAAPTGEETKTLLKDFEAALIQLQEVIPSKECNEIRGFIEDTLLPKAESIQQKINDGVMKNSETDAIKGELSAAMKEIKTKCLKAPPPSANTTRKANASGKINTSRKANASGKPITPLPIPPAALKAHREQIRALAARMEAHPEVGLQVDYGKASFTPLKTLAPLYTEYKSKKQEKESFGAYLDRAYPAATAGGAFSIYKKRNASTASANVSAASVSPNKKGFFTRFSKTNADIVKALRKEHKDYLASKYYKTSVEGAKMSFKYYVNDRYAYKLQNLPEIGAVYKVNTFAVIDGKPTGFKGDAKVISIEPKKIKLEVVGINSSTKISQGHAVGYAFSVPVQTWIIQSSLGEKSTIKLVKAAPFATPAKTNTSGAAPKTNSSGPPPPSGPPIGSAWNINRTGNTSIDPDKQYSVSAEVTNTKNGKVTYRMKTIKKHPPTGFNKIKVGNTNSIVATKWALMETDGTIMPESKAAPVARLEAPKASPPSFSPSGVNPAVGDKWLIDRTTPTSTTGPTPTTREKQYIVEAEITEVTPSKITYKIKTIQQQPKSLGIPIVVKPDTIDSLPKGTWEQLQKEGAIRRIEAAPKTGSPPPPPPPKTNTSGLPPPPPPPPKTNTSGAPPPPPPPPPPKTNTSGLPPPPPPPPPFDADSVKKYKGFDGKRNAVLAKILANPDVLLTNEEQKILPPEIQKKWEVTPESQQEADDVKATGADPKSTNVTNKLRYRRKVGIAGGRRRTRKQKRKVSKRKTRSRRV